jgi:ERCC4-type nuclease
MVAALATLRVPAETSALRAGDFSWVADDGRIWIIERKTWADFLASIEDGRLGDFLQRGYSIEAEGEHVALGVLIEGPHYVTRAYGPNWEPQRVDSVLVRLHHMRVATPRSMSNRHTPAALRRLWELSDREETALSRLHGPELGDWGPFRRVPSALRDALRDLMGIPGIGEKTALRMLVARGSAHVVRTEICDGDWEELLKLERVGPKVLARWQTHATQDVSALAEKLLHV